MYFCYFWKVKSLLILSLFISEYLDHIPPWKEIKEAFSVTVQTENLFLLKKLNKIKAAQIWNIVRSLSTFIRTSGPIPEMQKSALINDWQNLADLESKALANKFGLSQIQLGGLGKSHNPRKFGNFFAHLNLETVFPALKLTQNCYKNMSISFS